MKAIVQSQYGDESTLHLVEIDDVKVVKPDDILIDVHYCNVTAGDKNINTLSQPWYLQIMIRLVFGWNKPRAVVRGICGSGVIAQVGSSVTGYKVGDHVNFINSMKAGVAAEKLILNDKSIVSVLNPEVSLQEAACIPFGFLSAYHFLNESTLSKSVDVYLYGASGSVGSAALSLAHMFEANVVAVASAKHHQQLSSIHSQPILDYQTQDVFNLNQKFDVVFDAVGKIQRKQITHLLKPSGKFLSIKSVTKEDKQRLAFLNDCLSHKRIQPIIEKVVDLVNYKEAFAHAYQGHKTGNILIRIKDEHSNE